MAHYKKCERRINRTIYEYNLSNNFVLEKKFSPYSYFSVVSVVLYNAINFSSFVCVCVYVATSEVAIFFFLSFCFFSFTEKKINWIHFFCLFFIYSIIQSTCVGHSTALYVVYVYIYQLDRHKILFFSPPIYFNIDYFGVFNIIWFIICSAVEFVILLFFFFGPYLSI